MDTLDIATIIVVYSLILFGFDYLRDKDITHSEMKIGILQYLHHLVTAMIMPGSLLALCSNNVPELVFVIGYINIISQNGFVLNDGYCWLTRYINRQIGVDQDRKWIGGMPELVKHYIRGDKWAYSNIYNPPGGDPAFIINNLLVLLPTIKMLIKSN